MIKYLCVAMYLPLKIEWDKYNTLQWSINALFVVHNNVKSHTSAVLIFGKGAVFSMLSKQKVNSTRSTVAEMFDVYDTMNFVMWVKVFIEQ